MIPFAQTMNAFGQWLVGHLWRMSIELTILAAIVLAAIVILRIRSPRLRHLFLMLLLAKPVVTFLVASPLSLYGFLHPNLTPLPPGAPVVVVERAPGDVERPPLWWHTRPPAAIPRTETAAPSAWRSLDRYGLAAIVWMMVAGALGLRLIVGWAYVTFLRRTSHVQRAGPLVAAALEASCALKVRRQVTVARTSAAHGPVLAGVFRPMILLPTTLAEGLSPEQMRLILAHELVHVRRWDNLVLVIQRLAEMVLFFHPVVWLVGWAMRREAEADCDDTVIGAYGESAAYADSLTRVAETRAGLTRRLLVNTFAAAESNLARRVRRILRGRAARATLALSIVSVGTLIVIGCLGLPTASEPKPKPLNANRGITMKDQPSKPQSTVKREGSKVWIEGVPDRPVGSGWDMLLRGAGVLLTHRGEKTDLNELMVFSGDAFSLCFASHWQGIAYLCVPTDTLANVARAYGYKSRWLFSRVPQPSEKHQDKAREILHQLWSEIDQGRPVLVGGCADEGCTSWSVVTGYDPDSRQMCHVGIGQANRWTGIRGLNIELNPEEGETGFWNGRMRGTVLASFVGGWQANPAFLLGNKADVPSARDNALAALERAVEVFVAPEHHIDYWGGVTYWFGQEAYEHWAEALDRLDYPADLEKPRPDRADDWYDLGNMDYLADAIVRGRSAAADFCEEAAHLLPAGAQQLKTAAKCYREEVVIARKTFAAFMPMYDGNDAPRDAWLSDEGQRSAGVAAIRDMLPKERAAVAAIEKALAAEGVEAPSAKPVERITTVTTKPDLAKLKLEGGGHDKNWFALTVQSAARLLAKNPDYEMIDALSTNAFAPVIDPGEDCTAWWHMYAQDTCMDLVAGQVGLRAERPDLPPSDLTPADPPDVFQRKATKQRQACSPIFREAMDHGVLLLIDGGWKGQTDHGFVPWCWWGVLTRAEEDGTIQGATLNGRLDNPLDYVGGCWAVTGAQPTLSPRKADLVMLERAVERIRGQGERFQSHKYRVFGLAAMDLWIAKMETVPFCEPCYKSAAGHVWTCALNNGQTMTAGARTVSSYLRKRKDTFAAEARPHVEAAAERYDRIAALLAPAVTGEGGAHYRDFIGDLEKQKAHAKVLREVKTELAAAADDMEKALAAEGIKLAATGNLPDSDSASTPAADFPATAMLDDVPHGKGNSNSFARGLAIALDYVGTPVDYETIMGDTGQAFILQAEEGGPLINGAVDVGWWPLAAWGVKMRLAFLARVVGRDIREIEGDAAAYQANPAAFYRERFEGPVKASIAAGRPVLAEHDTCFVVQGYDEKEPPLLGDWTCRDEKMTIRIEEYPWGLIVLGGEVRPMDRRQADLEALHHAVALGKDAYVVAVPEFWPQWKAVRARFTGERAFALWAEALRDTEHLGEARWHSNMRLHLGIDRKSAVVYLRAMAKRHSANFAGHLNRAADLYAQVIDELKKADTSEDAMMSKDGREKLAKLVERIAAIEAGAAADLEKALALAPE
ncbi:MAG: M56 family metallopeptidase [Planctomycetota bacterium]